MERDGETEGRRDERGELREEGTEYKKGRRCVSYDEGGRE